MGDDSKLEEFFKAAQAIERQKAPEGLFNRIDKIIQTEPIQLISWKGLSAIAASLLILSLLNIQALKSSQLESTPNQELEVLILDNTINLY